MLDGDSADDLLKDEHSKIYVPVAVPVQDPIYEITHRGVIPATPILETTISSSTSNYQMDESVLSERSAFKTIGTSTGEGTSAAFQPYAHDLTFNFDDNGSNEPVNLMFFIKLFFIYWLFFVKIGRKDRKRKHKEIDSDDDGPACTVSPVWINYCITMIKITKHIFKSKYAMDGVLLTRLDQEEE